MKHNFKKAAALIAAVSVSATMLTAMPLSVSAAGSASYAGGTLTFTADQAYENASVYVAKYKSDNTLDHVTKTDINVTAGENTAKVEAAEGEKIFVWSAQNEPITAPVTVTAEQPTLQPTEDPATVIKTWEYDFTSGGNVGTDVNYMLNTAGEDQYGFIGTNEKDYNLGDRLDGFTTQKGQVITLTQNENGIGSTGEDSFGNAGDRYYPVRFALKVQDEQYFRITASVTTLDATKPANASLYTERKHPIISDKEIPAGETITKTFTIRTTPIYYEKSDPKGTIKDEMVNVCVRGENTAFKSLKIEQIETAPVLWVLGDSTVTDGNTTLPFSAYQNYTGVGTGLAKFIPSNYALVNEGEGGLTAADNAHFNAVKSRIKAGDYLYVEYGHNHKKDGTKGYVGCLDKYWQACKAVGATLVIVGPIDRHNADPQYNSTTNTWSTTLEGFSRAGKGYVDCMMYGGEEAANKYVSTYQSSAEAGALEYRDSVVAAANGVKAVENIAFVDLNAPSLRWYESITAKGTINNVEVTNASRLIDYYFQTDKGGATDGTHPNDIGAENLAYRFFTTADTEAYPAIKPLMKNFDDGVNEMPSQSELIVQNDGNKAGDGNIGWPTYIVPTDNEYPVVIKSINFDETGSVTSALVEVQDAKINMSAYGIIEITIYDADGNEIGKNYAVDQVDNSTGKGSQTVVNFKNDVKLPADGTYTAVVWQALDNGGDIGLTVDPKNVQYSAVYKPTEITDYILLGEDDATVDKFNYYGKDSLTGNEKWKIGGSAGKSTPLGTEEDGTTYAEIISDGAKNGAAGQGSFYIMRAFDNLTKGTGTNGRYLIQADLKYVSGGGLWFAFAKSTTPAKSPFVSEEFPAFRIDADGKVFINGYVDEQGKTLAAGQISATGYTTVQYILDMNAATAEITVGGGTPVVVPVANYATFGTPAPSNLAHFIIEGQKVAFDVRMTNLTVGKLKDTKNTATLTASIPESMAAMGTVDTASQTVAQGANASITATPNDGYVFTGWMAGDAEFSAEPTVTARMYTDLALTATFAKQSGVEGVKSFKLSADKKKMAAGTEQTVNLTVSDVCDEAGNPVEYTAGDITWSAPEGITVSDGVVTIPADYAATDLKNKITVTAAINNIENSIDLTLYSCDYFEDFSAVTDYSTWISSAGTGNPLFGIINTASDKTFAGLSALGSGNSLVIGNGTNKAGNNLAYDRDMALSDHSKLKFGFDIEGNQVRTDGKNASVTLRFADTNGTEVFNISVATGGWAGAPVASSFNGSVVKGFVPGTVVSVDTELDFAAKTMTYKLTNSAGAVMAEGTAALTAENLGKMNFTGDWQYGKFAIDNVYADYE